MLRKAPALFLFVFVLCGTVAPAAGKDELTFVDVSLNGVDKGQTVVALSGDDVSMLAKDLAEYGIPIDSGSKRSISGDDFVSLTSLAPRVRFSLNLKAFQLALTVAAKEFGTHDVVLAPQSGTLGDPRSSAFFNYLGTFDANGDAGVAAQIGLHRNNEVFSTGGSLQTGTLSSRGQTFLAFDDVPHMHRTQLGDSIVAGDALVGGTTLLGVTSSREFSLDPYAYVFPQPSVIGSIPTEGTAQIYVNGGLTRTVALQPGVFDLSQLPVQSGENQVSVVVRDARGNVQNFGQSYFVVDSLLRKGLTDFQYGAGFVENANGFTFARNPSLTASYRLGATDEVTYGAHFAAGNALQSGDLSADLKLGWAALHLAAAESAGTSAGAAFDAETALGGLRNSFGVGVTARTPGYATLGQAPPPNAPPQFAAHLSLSQQVTSRITLNLLAMRTAFAANTKQPSQDTVALTLGGSVGSATVASLSLEQSRGSGQPVQNTLNFMLVQSLGRRSTIATSAAVSAGNAGGTLQYRLEPPSSSQGFGYTVQLGTGSQPSLAQAVDHERFADFDGGLQRNGSATFAYGNVSGGVVSTGGYTLPSRLVSGGFAVVSVGEPDVQVLFNNSPAGLSDRNGLLVIPTLTAYANNALSVDRGVLPLGAEVSVDHIAATTSYLGGTLASLPVRRITYVSGWIRVSTAGKLITPSYGVLLLGPAARAQRSALDGDGYFYFEDLAAGRYPATVVYPGGRCSFELTVKRSKEIGTDLGEVQCIR